jgi:hypothetical protein
MKGKSAGEVKLTTSSHFLLTLERHGDPPPFIRLYNTMYFVNTGTFCKVTALPVHKGAARAHNVSSAS